MIRLACRPIRAAERFEALELCVAFERRKAEDPVPGELVLHGLEHAEFSCHNGPANRKAWSERFDADELPAAPPHARLEIVHLEVPGIARPLCFDCSDGAHRLTELRRVRGAAHLH